MPLLAAVVGCDDGSAAMEASAAAAAAAAAGGGISEEDAEVAEGMLELLAQLAEDDRVKEELAAPAASSSGAATDAAATTKQQQQQSTNSHISCSDILVRLVRESIESPSFDSEGDEDRQMLGKLSADLIVTLVTGDKAMEALYADGSGIVFQEAHRWLASNNEQLQTAGALGGFVL